MQGSDYMQHQIVDGLSALSDSAVENRELYGAIVGKSGMYKNAIIKIRSGESLIFGRDAVFASVVVDTDSPKVSRKHCEVVYFGADRGYQVTDYSSNGTFTSSGTKLKLGVPIMLSCGTTISLGNDNNSFYLAS